MQLEDSYNRQINYLRLSVIDHCNYRCFYCRPKDDEPGSLSNEFLNPLEIARIAKIFTELGVAKIRLTGGEPLIRKDIANIVARLANLPKLGNLSLSTNAHLLTQHANDLKQHGLNRVNISLDSLKPDRFFKITQGGNLEKVLSGIDAAITADLKPVKVNMVVMRDRNEDEIEAMLDYAISNDLELRFIETMPVGNAGAESMADFYPADKILKRVQNHLKSKLIAVKSSNDAGPARIYNVKNSRARIGVISALSQHFCQTCNRVRLTARGRLILCLGQKNSVSLKDAIRKDKTDKQIKNIIMEAVAKKPKKHEFNLNANNVLNTKMVSLGG